MNPLLHALADKPSSRQSFLYTGPSTDLDSIQHRADMPPGVPHTSDEAQQRRSMVGENGGVPRPHGMSNDGPKMVRTWLYSMSTFMPKNTKDFTISRLCFARVQVILFPRLYFFRAQRSESTRGSLMVRFCAVLCGGSTSSSARITVSSSLIEVAMAKVTIASAVGRDIYLARLED